MTTYRLYIWRRNWGAGNNNLPPFYWFPLNDYKTLKNAKEVAAAFPAETKYKIEKKIINK